MESIKEKKRFFLTTIDPSSLANYEGILDVADTGVTIYQLSTGVYRCVCMEGVYCIRQAVTGQFF